MELREGLIERAKKGIKDAYSSEEHPLIQAVNAWLELTKSHNLAAERLGEWFGVYAPSLEQLPPASTAKLTMLAASGELDRESVAGVVGKEKAALVYAKMADGLGRKMNSDESDAVAGFVDYVLRAEAAIERLEAYLKAASNRLMPNATYLTDEKIAAELLSKAGSLERLASMPASTVQLLGAEKALFKHIKYGSKPPKYGVLFKLPAVTAAPKDQKGRVARAYATKICIALKADFFSKRFIAEELKKSLDESLRRINESPPRERTKTVQKGARKRQGRWYNKRGRTRTEAR